MDNPVITSTQAKAITGGRTPLVPVVYEDAIKALVACRSIDDAKYFDNKADALAAWAKIHKSDEAMRESRALKLHAYRRMGQLAQEIQPSGRRTEGQRTGTLPGAPSYLRDNGLKKGDAHFATTLARAPKEEFESMAARPRPPSPSIAVRELQRTRGSEGWLEWTRNPRSPYQLRYFTRAHEPAAFARGLTPEEAEKARESAREVSDWLDEFERHLPKVKK